MIGYSVLMLLNQIIVGATGSMNWGLDGEMGSGMNGGMGNGMNMAAGVGWDSGMIALAVLMLISGILMTSRPDIGSNM